MGTLDGLSGIESLTSQINALKNTQNGAAGSSATGLNSTPDPGAFILQTQQNFNQMLNALTTTDQNGSSGSSDPFAFLTDYNNQTNSIQAMGQGGANTNSAVQNLSVLGQNSLLLGQQIIYYDTNGAQNSGVVSKIILDKNNSPVVVLSDGTQVAAGRIVGIQK